MSAMLRRVALLVGIGSVSFSQASFELALVMQTVTPSGGFASRAITRWDPLSRTALGYFLVTGTSDTVMALNSSVAGTVDTFGRVGSNLQIRRYNYGTGVLTSTINMGVATTVVNDAKYVDSSSLLLAGQFGASHAARIYSTAGALVRSFANPAGTNFVISAVQDLGGNTFVLSRQAGTTTGFKYTLTSYAAGSSAISNSVVVRDNTTTDLLELVFADGHVAVNLGVLSNRVYYPVTGTAFGTPGTGFGWGVATDTLAAGHGDLIHGFAYEEVNTRMILSTARINSPIGNSYQHISSTFYGTVYDSAIVVAPEPGTLLALGAGVGVLLRRRRKKA